VEDPEAHDRNQNILLGEPDSEPIGIEASPVSDAEEDIEQGDETQQNLNLKALGFREEEESDSQSDSGD
jgi:hypothetical protein